MLALQVGRTYVNFEGFRQKNRQRNSFFAQWGRGHFSLPITPSAEFIETNLGHAFFLFCIPMLCCVILFRRRDKGGLLNVSVAYLFSSIFL